MRECCCIFSCFNKLSQTVREIFEHRENQLLFIQEVKLCWLRVSFARVSWAQIASLKMPCYLMVGETTENQHKQRKHVNSTQQRPFLGLNPGLLAVLTTEPPCTNEKRRCKLRVRQKLVGITKEQVETCSAESRDLRSTVTMPMSCKAYPGLLVWSCLPMRLMICSVSAYFQNEN